MGGMMGGTGFGFGGFGLIGMILNLIITVGLIVGIVVLIVWAVKRFSTGSAGMSFDAPGAGNTPREVLQLRYARGEITREQYKEMLADLN